MTQTGAVLGGLALAMTPELRHPRIGWRDLLVGLGSAGGLYVVFQLGDRVSRAILPSGSREVADIYALRSLRPWPELALRLAAVIGPAEELFWRGLVQRRLTGRVGPWRAAALATASYGAAHLASRNVTLVGAATIAGAYWSALAAAGASMSSLVVSHVVWDIWIFLVAPTEGDPSRGRRSFDQDGD
jgi:membrane protease YdiL (CAAX protease family)